MITPEDKKLVHANVTMSFNACSGLTAAKWIIENFQKETALDIINWLINTLNCEETKIKT